MLSSRKCLLSTLVTESEVFIPDWSRMNFLSFDTTTKTSSLSTWVAATDAGITMRRLSPVSVRVYGRGDERRASDDPAAAAWHLHGVRRAVRLAPARVDDLVLNVGDATALRVRLKVEGLDENVTVITSTRRASMSPAAGVAPWSTGTIDRIPLNGRSCCSR